MTDQPVQPTNTELLYLHDAYLQTTRAKVVAITTDEKNTTQVVLDKTVFYAQGGGQPADQGTITGKQGKVGVSHVSYNGGTVLHKGKLEGSLTVGEEVTLQIDWQRRYQHMQWHTAGHIVDQAVKNVVPGAKSIDGNHGISKKMSITFTTPVSAEKTGELTAEVAKIVDSGAEITTQMMSKDEIVKRNITIPFDLPTNKPLRIMQIGTFPAMPDGGTHLKTTNESWPVTITDIVKEADKTLVIYTVQAPQEEKISVKSTNTVQSSKSSSTLSLHQLRNRAEDIKAELSLDSTPVAELSAKYLGKKGLFNALSTFIRDLAPEDRKAAGQVLNQLKESLEKQIEKRLADEQESTDAWTDMTAPGKQDHSSGHMHPVSQAMEEITQIFERIGFTRVRYPEVDWDFYAFEGLNMPKSHPARDEWETFFIDASLNKKFGKVVLTPHTSNGQVREMERMNSTPPIRMINIARCYRRQQDATHTQMFHQFEGLVVDKGITIQHLKGTLDYFAEQFYGPGTKSRIRPFHFQFTEPSFEVDFSCHICHGTGKVDGKDENGKAAKVKCRFCKSGWHEVGGAGMVHPNVLKAGGINPDEYTGFAFGWGIERTYTLKPGLNIDDIRLLYSGEMRFLEQF